MFMTLPQFEQTLPRALGPDGQRCWRVMELSFNHHWFFVTVRETDADMRFQRSLILGLDKDLLQMLRSDPPFEFASIELALPPHRAGTSWVFEKVRSVWSAKGGRAPQQELLLFETSNGELIEPFFNSDVSALKGRRLLLELVV